MRLFFIILCLLAGCTTPSHESSSDYVQVKQGKLYYQSFGSGEPIIVIHGGPGMMDSSYLLPQMLELTKTNQVIFYDQRGSGKSLETKINPELMNLEQFTQDLDDLHKSLNLDKVTLLGHSWGGIIAMNYAIKHPENMNKLILLNSAPADYKGQLAFTKEYIKRGKNIMKQTAPLYNYQELEKLTLKEINNLYKILLSIYVYDQKNIAKINIDFDSKLVAVTGIKSAEEIVKTSWMQKDFNLFPQLQKLHIPTLIIHGREDIVPVSAAEEINKAIPSSKLVIIEKCDHFSFVEQPEETFDVIKRFVNHKQN